MARWQLLLLGIISLLHVRLAAEGSGDEASGEQEDQDADDIINPDDGTPKFRTEPRFRPETLNLTYYTPNLSLLSPGYIFIAPIAKFYDWGPQIYDLDGTLVFYGDELPNVQKHIEDFKPCDYLGSKGTHLCWHDGLKRGVHGGAKPYGRKAIFDNTYRQVSMNYTYPYSVNDVYPNSHEMRPVDDGFAFLEPTYKPVQMDLTLYGGKDDGWVWDACFQEVDAQNDKPLFEWCYMDHYPVWTTNLFIPNENTPNITSEKAGEGTDGWPWDAFHINSIDKNLEGDYLVSIRHLDQVLKIAGKNNPAGLGAGEAIWRLGGKFNDFDMGSLRFSKQHSVRTLGLTASTETFSIFDNAWEGTNKPSALYSAGMIITITNATNTTHPRMTARLDVDFANPHKSLSPSQGNMQNLPNGNVIVGWGALPSLTEFNATGTPLWHAIFSKDDIREDFTYRAFKAPWTGQPYWSPKVLAYSSTCDISSEYPLVVYVSWNGATEVKRWRFSTASSLDGPWLPAGTFAKRGFETKVKLSSRLTKYFGGSFVPQVKVEALNAKGNILGTSNTTTFVPGLDTIKKKECNIHGCRMGFAYDAERYSVANLCRRDSSTRPSYLALLLVFLVLELLSTFGEGVIVWVVQVQSEAYMGVPMKGSMARKTPNGKGIW